MASKQMERFVFRGLTKAYWRARKHKLGTMNEAKFEMHLIENLAQLARDILEGNYHPSAGVAFVIEKPVKREIFAAPFRDRVVHHLIIMLVEDWWDKRFIYDSYSCRKGKGVDFALRRLYHHMRACSENFQKETYVLKFDIQSYFNSLPREKLYERAKWGVEQQFLGPGHTKFDREVAKMLLYLWREVIFDEPTENVTIKGTKKSWDNLPASKSLFHSAAGTGIVIGNLTSQVLSNVYLDQLDRFMKINLGVKHYGRYVDDFYVVLRAEEVADFVKYKVPVFEDFIVGLGLHLHPHKRFRAEINQGVPYLGAVLYPYRIVPDRRTKRSYYLDADLAASGVKIKGLESMTSHLGRTSHFDAMWLEKTIYELHGWAYDTRRRAKRPSGRWYTDPKM